MQTSRIAPWIAAPVLLAAGLGAAGLSALSADPLRPTPAHARAPSDLDAIADTAEAVLPAVVSVSALRAVQSDANASMPFGDDFFRRFFGEPGPDRDGPLPFAPSQGSGVLVRSGGVVLTNSHVVAGATTVTVTLHDGTELTADVIGSDPMSDLAALRIQDPPAGLPFLAMGDSGKTRLGEVVLAIGNPFGLEGSVSMGIVSAKGRTNQRIINGGRGYEDFIQTDAAINPGNSGGALVNLRGELIGINTAIASRGGGNNGVGFAIPSQMADPILTSLLADGTVQRAWLGVYIQDVDDDLAAAFDLADGIDGVLIPDVVAGGPGEAAGIQQGDVITRFDGQPVRNAADLRNRVALNPAGKTVPIQLIRKGRSKTISAKLGELPTEGPVARKPTTRSSMDGPLAGVEVAPLDRRTRDAFDLDDGITSGVVVTAVPFGSPASRAGLQPGDVLLEVNGAAVGDVDAFREAYVGGHTLLRVRRGDGALFLVLK